MGAGPIALFDKSFLQALNLEEAVWFDHYFIPNVCPLFYAETLADLALAATERRGSAEDEVRAIAEKTPETSGAPCVHHQSLCLAELLEGFRVPKGQIPLHGGRPVQARDGQRGVSFDQSPEAKAFSRWRQRQFKEVERDFARQWREMLTTLDLTSAAERMRALGINPSSCKSVGDAHRMAISIAQSNEKPFDQMALLFLYLSVPRHLHRDILQRWSINSYRPLAEYAPYSAHVLTVELFFQIALAAHQISAERPSNRLDIAYLFYLPFCQIFISGDNLHRRCTAPFLREDQEFVWAQDLKADLRRVHREFTQVVGEMLSP